MSERKCIECGASLLQDSLFCHVCGAKRKTCSCGAFLDAGMQYCAKCGKERPQEIEELESEANFQRWKRSGKEGEGFFSRTGYVELIRSTTFPTTFCMVEFFDPDNVMTWFEAMNYAKNLRIGGFSDWRLPSADEFELYLFPFMKTNSSEVKEDWQSQFFWAADTLSFDADKALAVNPNLDLFEDKNKSKRCAVICVR